MRITNLTVAKTFEDVADMLLIKGEIIHRIMAYRNAAQVIAELPRDLNAIYAEGKLEEIPHIGATLAEKIEEMLTTGKLEFYERLAKEIPPSMLEVLRVNGVGPKKAHLFREKLGIITLEALEKAARAGELQNLPGMGKKSEQKIIEGIESLARQTDRLPIGVALPLALNILEDLLTLPEAKQGHVAGSLRRFRPTIGDIDLLVMSDTPAPIMERFVTRSDVVRVLGHGQAKSSIELVNGRQVDVRVLPPEKYGTGLAYFTGSQAHNIRMRELALEKGLSLNEHAYTATDGSGREILCATEEEVYAVLGLPYIPPELRENQGEIEAAQRNALPQLIGESDMLSNLHMHTTESDGKATLREVVNHARSRGLKYIVITDHSRSLGVANGLSIERLLAQQAEIRAVDAEMGGEIRVLHGTEMEIKADGTLDYPDEILAQLDVVIASLHVSLRQPREQVTQRMLNAISNPHVDIIAHPTGQLIPSREPADLDMDAVFEAAKQHDIALEINANPMRLDLSASYARRAAELGIKITINTDAHALEEFDVLPYGIGTARRAWLTAEQVINTWPIERFLNWVTPRGK